MLHNELQLSPEPPRGYVSGNHNRDRGPTPIGTSDFTANTTGLPLQTHSGLSNCDTTLNCVTRRPATTVAGTPHGVFLDLVLKLEKYREAREKHFSPNVNYTSVFNSWLGSVDYVSYEEKTLHHSTDGGRLYLWRVSRSLEFNVRGRTTSRPLRLTAVAIDSQLRRARNKLSYLLFQKIKLMSITVPKFQSDDGQPVSQESIQGAVDQQAVKSVNTTITMDTTETVTSDTSGDTTQALASTELIHKFPSLTDRWMPLSSFEVLTSQARGYNILQLTLPSDLYTKAKCAPNIAPFEAFMYGALEIELRIVLNANKFQAGKIVASYRCDSYKATDIALGSQGLLSRPHVILDLAARNEGVLRVPWKFHTPFMRLVSTSEQATAAQAGTYAVVDLNILSPLNVSSDGLTTAYGQIFYRVKRTDFAGMTYRVSFQGDTGVDAMVQQIVPTKTVRAIAKGLEAAVDQLGSSNNQDKPNNPSATIIVPRPRSMFPNMKGVDDSTTLRPSATGMTNFDHIPPIGMEPRSPKDLARIWGLRTTSTWNTSDVVGTRIFSLTVDPSNRNVPYYSSPTPLEYAMGFHNFWSGPIELRVDFVCTAFHQGSIMLSIEFGRPVTDTTDLCSTASTYTKTFHLGDQRSVTMIIPYIYDTVYRRSNGALQRTICSDGEYPTNTSDLRQGISMGIDVHTVIRATVVNELKPVQNVASNIDVLVFWRAGENFTMNGLKQCDFSALEAATSSNYIHNLPSDYTSNYTANTVGAIRVQMDTGDKENEDCTPSFSIGRKVAGAQNSDEEMDFKDILRRPTLIQYNTGIVQSRTTTGSNLTMGYFIPVMPPSRSFVPLQNASVSPDWCMGGVATSPSTAVVNLFRFWRGSSKYTLHFLPDSSCNLILVTYIPHSGVTLHGNRNFPTVVTSTTGGYTLPFMGGYATEMVVPSVNPTCSVVTPYETENNWTYTWDSDPSANYTWRDKGNLNAGHLVIQPIGGDAVVNIWWSAGDDFQLSCFWGMPYVYNEACRWRMNEDGSYNTADIVVSPEVTSLITARGLTLTGTSTTTTARRKRETTVNAATTSTTRQPREEYQAPPLRHARTYTDQEIAHDLSSYAHLLRRDNPRITPSEVRTAQDIRSQTLFGRVLPHAQADDQDFTLSNTLTRVGGVMAKVTPKLVRNIALSAVPVIGTSLAVATVATETAETVDNTLTHVTKSADKIGDAAEALSIHAEDLSAKIGALSEKIGTGVDSIVALLENTVKGTASLLSTVADGASMVFDLLLDVFIAWYDKSWTAVGVGIIRLLGKTLPGLAVNVLMSYGTQLGAAISQWVLHATTPNTQAPTTLPSTVHVVVGLLAGAVGTMLGVYLEARDYYGLAASLMSRMTKSSGVMYFIHMINFVRMIFDVVKSMVMKALGMVSPEAEALNTLSGKSAELQAFLTDAQEVTCEANHSLLAFPAYRVKAWKTVMQAYQLQRLMSQVPNNVVSPIVSRLCADVIKMGNEKFVDMASCPVRYEPFVICVEGETNIGKSYMVETLVERLLASIDYSAPASGLVYYRQPGSEYWSGMRDQPAVVFDEWMQSNDAQATNTQLTELFQLKTTATFIPNMAHLEEKRIRVNPLIVILATNNAFPRINTVHSPKAVLRRRDIVFRAYKKAEYADQGVRYLPDEVKRKFGHLNFNFYAEPCDDCSLDTTNYDFEETIAELVDHFTSYHTEETKNVALRLEKLFALNRTIPPRLIDVSDPFKIFYSVQSPGMQVSVSDPEVWIASQRLATDAQAIFELIRAGETARIAAQADQAPVISLGTPTQQMSMDLVCMGITAAARWFYTSTMAPLAYTSHYVAKGLRALGRSIVDRATNGHIMSVCSVCQEECPIHLLCTNEANAVSAGGQARHAVCDSCWSGVDRGVSPDVCPVCRCRGRHPIMSEQEATLFTRLLVGLGDGILTVSDFVNILAEFSFHLLDFQRFVVFVECVHLLYAYGFACPAIIVPYVITTGALLGAEFAIRGGHLNPLVRSPPEPFTEVSPIRQYLARLQADDPEAPAAEVPLPLDPDLGEDINIPALAHPLEEVITSDLDSPLVPTPPPPSATTSQTSDTDAEFVDAGVNPRAQRRAARAARLAARHNLMRDVVQEVRTVADAFRVVVHDLDSRGLRVVKHTAPCTHDVMMTGMQNVHYRESRWFFQHEGMLMSVADGLCSGTVDRPCVWAGESGRLVQLQFYREYLEINRTDITSNVYRWINQSSPVMRDHIVGSIPPVYRPTWMYNPAELDVEARTMTSDTWWTQLSAMYEKYKVVLQVVGAVVAACTALAGGYAMYKFMFANAPVTALPGSTFEVSGNLASSISVEQSPKGDSRHAQRAPLRRGPPPRTQADIDEAIERYIMRNTVSIEWREGENIRSVMHGLGICGHKVLIPGHYLRAIRDPAKSIWIGPMLERHKRIQYTYDRKDFVECINNDMAIWTWPASTDAFKDIRKFFVTETDLKMRPLPRQATLYVAPGRNYSCMHAVEVEISSSEQAIPVIDDAGEMHYVIDVLTYNFSRAGACGSTLVTTNTQRPLIGMHVAGQGEDQHGTGYAVIVTQELLASLQCDAPAPPEIALEQAENGLVIFDPDIQVSYAGALSQAATPHTPSKSKLERSSVFGLEGLTCDSEPAILHPKDPRYTHDKSPLIYGAEAHGKLTKDFTTSQLEGPTRFLDDLLSTLKPLIVNPKKLTTNEVVCGFKDFEHYDPMDLKTSMGYPHMLTGKQKQDHITVERDEDQYPVKAVLSTELEQTLKDAQQMRRSGERFPTLWVDTPKDEKRPQAKVMKKGGTRIICNGPVEHSMAMRSNFLHFAAAFMKHRNRMYHSVGINPVSVEWNALAARLLSKSKNITTLDYTNFGPGLNARVAQIVVDAIIKWTLREVEGVDETEMNMIMAEIVNSYHICVNTVYSQNSGSPSGNALTSVINSLVNIVYILVAWQEILGPTIGAKGKLVFEEFKRCVCLSVYGDDLIMSVADYEEGFNTVTISKFFKGYNIVATDALKTAATVPTVPLTEAEFLKRKFVRHPFRPIWMSQLREETLKSTTQWVWKSPNRDLSTHVNCDVAVLNAHGFGPEEYEKFRATVNKALVKRRLTPLTSTWDEVDSMIYDKGAVLMTWL